MTAPRSASIDAEVAEMSPACRRAELAAILAQAALRLRARAALGPSRANGGEISGEPGRNRLDLSGDQSVHGDPVVNARESLHGGAI